MLFAPLCSGSSGNASYLEAGGVRLLVDAGVNGKRMEELLTLVDVSARGLDAILVTHEHIDHVAGVGVLSRRYDIPVYAAEECWLHMPASVGAIAVKNRRVFEPDRDFYLKQLCVHPFSIPHDSARPVGYTFVHEGKKLALMTDIGHVSGAMLDAVAGSNLLLLEAHHDVEMLKAGSYPYPLKMRILSSRGHLCKRGRGIGFAETLRPRREERHPRPSFAGEQHAGARARDRAQRARKRGTVGKHVRNRRRPLRTLRGYSRYKKDFSFLTERNKERRLLS